jgi:adenosylcobinamide kinase/adenosylcobinamide-phosphate guanylyltransferase
MVLTFVTGPVSSGKSRMAERLATATGFAVTYVFTMRPEDDDAEWRERAAQSAARRPPTWRFVETARPGAPTLEALLSLTGERETVVIDSLPGWLATRMTAHLGHGDEEAAPDAALLQEEGDKLLAAIAATRGHVIVVGEEIGWGAAPTYLAGRVLRAVAGRLQARLAVQAERAYLVVNGFAIDLRTQGRAIER